MQTINVSFEVKPNHTPTGLLVYDEIWIDGRYVGWVDMDNNRVTILSRETPAWVEVTLKRKPRTHKAAWQRARKVFPGMPEVGPNGQFGKCLKEGDECAS